MTKYVYDFSEGDKDLKDLLGGKGANLAEMTNLGLPVPPGFTITTEACQAYLADRRRPPRSPTRSRRTCAALEETMGRSSATPHDPLLVSVRSGRQVLDARHDGDGAQRRAQRRDRAGAGAQAGNERFAWDSYRRLIQMFGSTVSDIHGEPFSTRSTTKKAKGAKNDLDLDADDLKSWSTPTRRSSASTPATTSRRSRASSSPRDRGGVPLLEHRARPPLPAPGADPARPRHRGQRLRDGLRQPRRGLRHRRRFTRDPASGAQRRLRRLPAERAGRGRRRRHPQHAPAAGAGGASTPSYDQLLDIMPRWRATTATCATSSSRSSAASCGCSRPGSASAPPRPRSGSPPSSSTRA